MKISGFQLFIVLLLCLCLSSFAGVKKKRFDVPGAASENTAVVVEQPKAEESTSLWLRFAGAQKELREKVSLQVSAMKEGNTGAVGSFVLICLLYGLLHALGPGHGKSIVVGYFLARRGGWKQGLGLGAAITFTHTLSAVVLLLILYAILKAAVFPTFELGREGIEKASYGLVMLTGVLLLGLGIKDLVTRHEEKTAVAPNARWREIIGVAAVTGIVPCPAVALIVLFCLLNNMVLLSLVGALFICIGMTLTNMSFGIFAVAFRKGIDKGAAQKSYAAKIYAIASIMGGLVIFVSGLMLVLNMYSGRI